MSTHTPGPWEYLQSDGVVVTQASDFGAHEIAWSDADYRLVAAAPDLLAAVKAARRVWGTAHPTIHRQLVAAIQKAEESAS